MGLSFTIAADPRQRSHSRVTVPRGSWSSFSVSDSRLPQPGGPGHYIYFPQEQGGPVIHPRHWVPFSSPPTTRRATVEIIETASIMCVSYQSKSKLLHDWWFTAIHFFLASRPLRLTTTDFFRVKPYGNSPYVTSSVTRRCVASQLFWDPRYIASGRIYRKHPFYRYPNNTSIVPCLFVAAETCLPSLCLAMNVYSEFTIPGFGRHVTVFGPRFCHSISNVTWLNAVEKRSGNTCLE
jgi:hypothetical protein